MADIRIDNGDLILTMNGIRRFLTAKKELTFPINSIRGVTHDPTIQSDFPSGWEKRLGTNIFNTYYGRTYRQDGETIFWDVRKSENTVVITLDGEDYQRLMVEVDDPKSTVQTIEEMINSRR